MGSPPGPDDGGGTLDKRPSSPAERDWEKRLVTRGEEGAMPSHHCPFYHQPGGPLSQIDINGLSGGPASSISTFPAVRVRLSPSAPSPRLVHSAMRHSASHPLHLWPAIVKASAVRDRNPPVLSLSHTRICSAAHPRTSQIRTQRHGKKPDPSRSALSQIQTQKMRSATL